MSFIPTGSSRRRADQQTLRKQGTVDWSGFLHRPASPPPLDCIDLLSEKRILITGAGGSIGTSLARLLMDAPSGKLIFLDRSASNLDNLYEVYRGRSITFPEVVFAQGEILDADFLAEIFLAHEPEIVFHAAALKHVVQLESDPFSALETNLLGTLRVLETAGCFPVQHFINLSTDKAVNPTSMLGVSKRIVELVLQSIESSRPWLISARLGNVLESSESVARIFLECLHEGCALPITDPLASRYFLTLEEAGAFLIQALALKENATLLPEMGSSRTVLDLAQFLSGTFPQEVSPRIRVTGLRDGEKRFEELLYDYESLEPTAVSRLSRVRSCSHFDAETLVDDVGRLLELVVARNRRGLLEELQNIVPEFRPSRTLMRTLQQ